ncbi:MAG: multidrug effflux MFS transporter [Proteobacteria bacterium]|nr:multidrug effflux MFS transporter [Pseudomonadota bacterium]MDA1058103.1 multidrug effflux MFS transporter [Pseudomonadota bacterium]
MSRSPLRPGSIALILFVGGLVAVGPLSTDMYLPALPSIRIGYGSTVTMVQLTFSLFLVGFAVGQLIVGPLGDRFGRRPILLGGMLLYAVTSLAAGVAPSIEWLIVLRFFQALGAAAAWVLSRAIVRDLHPPEETTRILGYTTGIMGALSALVPITGGLLAETLGWQAIFFTIAGFATIYLAVIALWFDETTVPNRDAIRPLPMLRTFRQLLLSRIFSGYAACLCLSLGAMFSFMSGGALVFIDTVGLSPSQFGAMFLAMAPVFSLASFITGWAVRWAGPKRLFGFAVGCTVTGTGILFVLALSGSLVLTIVVPALMMVTFGLGFIMPLCFSGALGPYPKVAGTASSLIGFLQAAFSALVGVLVAVVYNGSAVPVFGLMLSLMCASAVVYFIVLRPVMNRPTITAL